VLLETLRASGAHRQGALSHGCVGGWARAAVAGLPTLLKPNPWVSRPPHSHLFYSPSGGLNLGALLLALMVAMGVVWWGAQADGDDAARARARKLRSTDVD
jgi:hypothetical protein